MPHKKKGKKRFTHETIEDYFDARTRCCAILSVYEQLGTARKRAEESEAAHLQEEEAELLDKYLTETNLIAEALDALNGFVPKDFLDDLYSILPGQIGQDVDSLRIATT